MTEDRLRKLRLYVLGDNIDTSADDILEQISLDINQRLIGRLNQIARNNKLSLEAFEEVPSELEWIVDELTITRYNRLGSEGINSESVEGHSVTFDTRNELGEYESELLSFLDDENTGRRAGRIVIL